MSSFSASASVTPDFSVAPESIFYLYLNINNSWPNQPLRDNYEKAVKEHNEKLGNKNKPSGFDLILPRLLGVDEYSHIQGQNELFCDLKVKAAMYEGSQPVSYLMYACSSLEETPLRLPVNPRILDSDERDNLHTSFDINPNFKETWVSDKHHRLLKICSWTGKPFRVVIVDTVEELSK